jgi:hypothetical protein
MQIAEVHERGLRKSAQLSGFQVDNAIPPLDVIRVLNAAKISFVLVGAYGLAGWRKEARATEDVDVVVAARQVKRAVRVLCEAFPELESLDLDVVVRLRRRGTEEVAIDVIKPIQQPYREAFKHTQPVQSGREKYRVPSLEMAILMKYSAMTSLIRAEEDIYQDAHDFILMVKNNPELNKQKLAELGTLLYDDGRKDVLEMVRKALAGEKLYL